MLPTHETPSEASSCDDLESVGIPDEVYDEAFARAEREAAVLALHQGQQESSTSQRPLTFSLVQRKRAQIAYVGLLGVFLALIGRLSWIQLYDHPVFLKQAKQRQDGKAVVLARRGPILDRCKRVLAETVWVESATADPSLIKKKRETAQALALALGVDFRATYAKLLEKRRFVWIKRFLHKKEAVAVRKANLTGVFLTREPKRVYPLGRVACHVVGFCTIDGEGLEGVEAVCNSALSGEHGHRAVWRDGARRCLVMPSMEVAPPQNGRAVVLTIDAVIQSIVHQELRKAMAVCKPEAAIGLVLDCNKGEVLAMVNFPDYCPDRFASGEGISEKRFTKEWAEVRRLRAVTDTFEPGSIFKPFVASGAFDYGVVKPEDVFYCHNGTYAMGPRVLHDAHGYGDLSARKILIKSSNIGMAQIARKLGKERLYEVLRRYGFGQRTGFDLPGEPCGTLRRPEDWKLNYSLPSIAMGQEIAATPLRLAVSFCALVNGGIVPRPSVIMAHIDPKTDAVIWSEQAGQSLARAISPETSRGIIAPILADVVRVGTGKRAAQEGYALGGKTGTAQLRLRPPKDQGKGKAKKKSKPRGYDPKGFLGSFLAAAPIEDPKICVAVMMVRPIHDGRKLYYGGRASAPAAGNIVRRTLQYLGVRPRYETETCQLPSCTLRCDSNSATVSSADYSAAGTTRIGERAS